MSTVIIRKPLPRGQGFEEIILDGGNPDNLPPLETRPAWMTPAPLTVTPAGVVIGCRYTPPRSALLGRREPEREQRLPHGAGVVWSVVLFTFVALAYWLARG